MYISVNRTFRTYNGISKILKNTFLCCEEIENLTLHRKTCKTQSFTYLQNITSFEQIFENVLSFMMIFKKS